MLFDVFLKPKITTRGTQQNENNIYISYKKLMNKHDIHSLSSNCESSANTMLLKHHSRLYAITQKVNKPEWVAAAMYANEVMCVIENLSPSKGTEV